MSENEKEKEMSLQFWVKVYRKHRKWENQQKILYFLVNHSKKC